MTAFWDIALCSLVEVNQRFRGDKSPMLRGSKHLWNMSPFETSPCYIPESCLHTHCCQNLKSHNVSYVLPLCAGVRAWTGITNLHTDNAIEQHIKCRVLTVLDWGASVCLLITMVVVFRSVLGPPGDLGTNSSVGLEGLFTSNSAALTTSNT
jgi:hypothetical protein